MILKCVIYIFSTYYYWELKKYYCIDTILLTDFKICFYLVLNILQMEAICMNTLKYEQLKSLLKQQILDGAWQPGEKLPIEATLCEQFGVSMATVKKAKQDLVTEGFLEILPNRKGVFVRANDHKFDSGMIGVAIDTIQDPFRASILEGIEEQLWEHKLHTILCNVNYDHQKVAAYFESLSQKQVSGIIFSPVKGAGADEQNQQNIQILADHQIPYVLLDRYLPDFQANSVVSDNRHTSKKLTSLLIHEGHARILTLAGSPCSSIHDRLQGHLDAVREAGIAHDPRLLITLDDVLLRFQHHAQQAQEIERLTQLIDEAGDFTACYAMNVRLLQVALPMLARKVKAANAPLAVATYDDAPGELREIANRARVVKQPGYQMGWEAARLLIDTMQKPGRPFIQITLQAEIIEEQFTS